MQQNLLRVAQPETAVECQSEPASTAVTGVEGHLPRHGPYWDLVARNKQAEEGKQQKPKKVKPPPPAPTFIVAGSAPADLELWQNSVVLVDKPLGWTSFDVCGKLRGALTARLRIKKVGHAGTLDPMATGLLIVCIGKATKHVDSFMALDKTYSGTLRLGESTPSYDRETEVGHTAPWQHITEDELERAKQQFLGDFQQLPPMFSAVRINGERLYHSARKGEEVERPARAVCVPEFEVRRDEQQRQDVHFRVRCSKGTYIRSLAHDLGQAAGSLAYLTALRREAIGHHSVSDAWKLDQLMELLHSYPPMPKPSKPAVQITQAKPATEG
ncbi:hypothetical protein WJX72_008318 [[Myrmecia] bisecta]|uniref:tRNA pseudouridine(55) synthase n=1 Tax=[Myrmecia] bisecta TaxID=41462 RepID=A0AAW1PB29_9CHLO